MRGTKCLDRRFRPMAESLIRFARRFGPYQITSSCRSRREQTSLYRHRAENPFPVARPGHSMHERGLAIDMGRPDIDPYSDLTLHAIGASWRATDPSLGWSESDPVHFQWNPDD